MYQRQLDVKATRNHTLYDSRKSGRLWPYGCTPVDEKERVGGSWLSRGVPTPRVPRELRTRGAPRGSSMLAIQLLAIRVMYASTGDGEQGGTISNNHLLWPSCSRQPGKSVEGYCTRRRRDRDYQIAGVTCASHHQEGQEGWTGECHSLGREASQRNLSATGCHRALP